MPIHRWIQVNQIRLHYVTAGIGPAVVLLHGWPQTWYAWRKVIAQLESSFTVIAPDLRGYGESQQPLSGYDKRTMAEDIAQLMAALGFSSAWVVGHDRGARVAHRLALDHPERVRGVALLDILPTRWVVEHFDWNLGQAYWHWLFHQVPGLPEMVMAHSGAEYLRYFFKHWSYVSQGIDEDAVTHYLDAYSRSNYAAGLADYRATNLDVEQDRSNAERKLVMPLLVLWGEQAGLIGGLPVCHIWEQYAESVTGQGLPECGHFLPEERPELVADALRRFISETAG